MIAQLASLLPARLRPRTLLRRRLERVTRSGLVLGGPFKGLRYVGQSVRGMWWPKILGTYELELGDVVRDLCHAQPACIVDVGSAEGYYAVGFAWRCPAATVISFEADPDGRDLQTELAALNGVSERLRLHGRCDHVALRRALAFAKGGLVLCDLEGDELALLDPAQVPALSDQNWTLLVEIHDHVDTTILPTLVNRFAATHTVEEIVSRPRRASDLPVSLGGALLARWVPAFLDERRPGPMRWLLLRPAA